MAEAAREQIVIDVSTKGVDEAGRSTDKLLSSLDRLEAAQGRQASSSDKANAAAERSARAKAQAEAAAARMQRSIDAENRALDAMAQANAAAAAATGGLTAAQLAAIQAMAQASKAANDNAAAVKQQGEAARAAGKFFAEHPVLVLAASVAAARALGGLATSAAGSLAAASLATGRFGESATGMGGAVAAGAGIAARGLGFASTAATAAAGGLGRYAETVGGMTSGIGLLSRALGVLPGFLGPIGVAFLAFEVGSALISKAYADLAKLVDLGKQAEHLDLGAPFVKSFESLAPKIRASADEMAAMLQKASSFVQDRHGQPNALTAAIGDLYSGGWFGSEKPASMDAAEVATTTEAKIRAAIAAMQELQQRGHELAAIDLAEKLFGSTFTEKLRTGQTTIAQFSADLDAASRKELLRQEDVDKALALSRNIEDVKRGISDAVAVNLDFSAAAIKLDEAWLRVLQTVKLVVDAINEGIAAVGNFISTLSSGITSAFQKFGSMPIWGQINEYMDKLGLMDKEWRKTGEAAAEPLQLKIEPKIGYRGTSEMYGPFLPQAQQQAKQAQQAAQEAVSAYDNLIQRTKDRIEELDLETKSVGQTTDAVIKMKLAHDLERAAQKSGIDVTADMRAEWDKLGTSLAASTERLAEAKRQLEVTREAQRELGDEFSTFAEDVILGGKKISEAFAGLAKTFASGSLKALLTGQGGLAGVLGTAPDKAGEMGGIFGKLDFSKLFPTREMKEAVAGGTADGNASFWDGLFKQQKSQQGASEGFFSSPIGQGLASVGVGASIGYSSQSPVAGALGGALAGLVASGGNPIMAAAGPAVGFGGTIGKRRPAMESPQPGTQEKPRDSDQRPLAA